MNQVLDVYVSTELVGKLQLDDEQNYVFQYEPSWITEYSSQPLSISLPVRAEPYRGVIAQSFFSNLLPEADIRLLITKRLGLSENNDFALLEAIGGECAGAVSLFPEQTILPTYSEYKKLDDSSLNNLLDALTVKPMMAGEEDIRLSLAGAQNKLPVFYAGSEISIPMGLAASSHILKPPIKHYAHSVENEYFCMQLAKRVGLNVPETQLLNKATPLYLITRYDRVYDESGALIRLLQEDVCQALSILPHRKYEKEGGPSLQACFEVVRLNSIQPVKDLSSLLSWVIFNYLIGNADAHGKNVSLLLTPQGPQLAPFYDLMSTAVYPSLAKNMAMKIGGEDRPDWVIASRWEQFSLDAGIKFKLVREMCLKLAESLSVASADLANEMQQQYGENQTINKIVAVIEQRKTKFKTIFS